jgi:hypothetical protein
MSVAVFDLLPDFGAPRESARLPASHTAPTHDVTAHDVTAPPKPQADIGTLIAEAVAEAEAALTIRLEERHRAQLEAERRAGAEEQAAFLEAIGGDVGRAVAASMDRAEARLSELAGAAVARMLGGVLSEDLQRRSLQALARVIAKATADAEAVRIRVRGPAQLFETLKTALGGLAGNLDFTDAAGFDLTVAIDDVVFETQMAEWSAALSETLA